MDYVIDNIYNISQYLWSGACIAIIILCLAETAHLIKHWSE